MSKEKVLWCIWITGMDDLIPVNDVCEAVNAAAFINADFMMVTLERLGRDVFYRDTFPWAVPRVWEHSAESHAEELEKLKNRAKEEGCAIWQLD